jgi:hypothetical protein
VAEVVLRAYRFDLASAHRACVALPEPREDASLVEAVVARHLLDARRRHAPELLLTHGTNVAPECV